MGSSTTSNHYSYNWSNRQRHYGSSHNQNSGNSYRYRQSDYYDFYGEENKQKNNYNNNNYNNKDEKKASVKMSIEDALCLFALSKNCTIEQLKQRYRQLARIYHPDSNMCIDETMIKKVNEGYELLTRILGMER